MYQFEPHRILITSHNDLIVRIQDISVQLLVGSNSCPISSSFPASIPSLTIDLVTALSDESVLPRCSPEALQEGSIQKVFLSTESLECSIILKTGEIFIYRLDSKDEYTNAVPDKELVSLTHIPTTPHIRYRPFLMVTSERGPVMTFASADIGEFSR